MAISVLSTLSEFSALLRQVEAIETEIVGL